MMSLDKFIEQSGFSPVTLRRGRKKGMLTTVHIYWPPLRLTRVKERPAFK